MELSKYKFTIIIPVYNSEKWVEDTIQSVIKQSIGFENIQLIIVDDGSIDNSVNICKAIQKEYPKNKNIDDKIIDDMTQIDEERKQYMKYFKNNYKEA